MKENFFGQQFENLDELFVGMETFLANSVQNISMEWKLHFQICHEMGESVE
jgi:hypothetical protein